MEKVLSIGISGFSNKEIDIRSDIYNLPSLFDYDIVIINPNSLITNAYHHEPWKIISGETNYGLDYMNILQRMKKESAIQLEKGGIIICLVTPETGIQFYNSIKGKDVTFTNYDWVPIQTPTNYFRTVLNRGEGKGINIKTKSPFDPYLKNDAEWQAYFDDVDSFMPNHEIYEEFHLEGEETFTTEILAKNEGNKPISIQVNAGKGLLVFLPWSNHNKFPDILLQGAINSKSKNIEKPPPIWLKNYPIPEEEKLQKSLDVVNEKLTKTQKERDTLQIEYETKTNLKKLLYEQSDALEEAVKSAFEELGIPMTRKGSKDWIANIEKQEVIIEVTGQIGTIDVTKLSQLIRYRLEEEEESKQPRKAILVANHFADTNPEERGDVFTDETEKRANSLSTGLLSTQELFDAVCKFREKKISSTEIKKKLIDCTGICKLV